MKIFIIYILGAILSIKYGIATWYFLSTIGIIILVALIKRETIAFEETRYNPICNECNEGNDACETCPHKHLKEGE